ncbi:MAG: hypothetical protein ABI206_16280 [Antricoccus sp.]
MLRSFNYSFTLISWLDDSQPAAGIIIGVVGVVMVVAGLLIKSVLQTQLNVPNPGQQPGGAPWLGQQALGQQPVQGQQQGGAPWPAHQAPGQQPAQGPHPGGTPWPGQQGVGQQYPSQQAPGQNSPPQFSQRPQSPQQFNAPQSGQFSQPPQAPERH